MEANQEIAETIMAINPATGISPPMLFNSTFEEDLAHVNRSKFIKYQLGSITRGT